MVRRGVLSPYRGKCCGGRDPEIINMILTFSNLKIISEWRVQFMLIALNSASN